ncbi:transglutaminase-like cysteine peptidase [Rhodobium gokarnense]
MASRQQGHLVILAAVGALLLGTSTASAARLHAERFMPTAGNTTAPIGHVQFCKANRGECSSRSKTAKVVQLTRSRWNEMIEINDYVNGRIKPVTDQELYKVAEYWTYPTTEGDCEDYVLLKARILADRGWPKSALLITVVRDTAGDGHAVLTVRTDRGDFVLDNQVGAVLPWNETEYRYVKRQSETDSARWKRITDNRVTAVGSLAKR